VARFKSSSERDTAYRYVMMPALGTQLAGAGAATAESYASSRALSRLAVSWA
jgi:hypothetical protein